VAHKTTKKTTEPKTRSFYAPTAASV